MERRSGAGSGKQLSNVPKASASTSSSGPKTRSRSTTPEKPKDSNAKQSPKSPAQKQAPKNVGGKRSRSSTPEKPEVKAGTSKQSLKPAAQKQASKNVAEKKTTKKSSSKGSSHVLHEEFYTSILGPVTTLDRQDSESTSLLSSSPVALETATKGQEKGPALTCPTCLKGVSSQGRLKRCIMLHKLQDANLKRPKPEELEKEVADLVTEALQEISEEQGSDEKKDFVLSVLSGCQSKPTIWQKFVKSVSEPLVKDICKPSKLIPSNQFEEQLIAVNKLLNNSGACKSLADALVRLSCKSIYQESKVPSMVLFRVAHKLSDKLGCVVFDKMKSVASEVVTDPCRIKNANEERAFQLHVQKLVQKFYIKGLSIGSRIWLAKCACIRQNFIEILFEHEEQTIISFICRDDSWEENEDGEVQVKLRDDCVQFFVDIEEIIESLIRKTNVDINCDVVLSVLFDPENIYKLNLWYSLTGSCFSETESLIFLRELARILIDMSLKFEEGRMRKKHESDRIQKYALRTDLKRN